MLHLSENPFINQSESPYERDKRLKKENDLQRIKQEVLEVGIDVRDRKYLTAGHKELFELFKSAEENDRPYKTIICLARGARLLGSFVKGITDTLYGGDERPDIQFLAISKNVNEVLIDRLSEIKQNHPGPYLVVDDYSTARSKTYQVFLEASHNLAVGIADDDVTFFSFIGESDNQYLFDSGTEEEKQKRLAEIPLLNREDPSEAKKWYKKNNIHIGSLDEYGTSYGFSFAQEDTYLSGTTKFAGLKYEKSKTEMDTLKGNANAKLDTAYRYSSGKDKPKFEELDIQKRDIAEAQRKIRKLLYRLGAELTKEAGM